MSAVTWDEVRGVPVGEPQCRKQAANPESGRLFTCTRGDFHRVESNVHVAHDPAGRIVAAWREGESTAVLL